MHHSKQKRLLNTLNRLQQCIDGGEWTLDSQIMLNRTAPYIGWPLVDKVKRVQRNGLHALNTAKNKNDFMGSGEKMPDSHPSHGKIPAALDEFGLSDSLTGFLMNALPSNTFESSPPPNHDDVVNNGLSGEINQKMTQVAIIGANGKGKGKGKEDPSQNKPTQEQEEAWAAHSAQVAKERRKLHWAAKTKAFKKKQQIKRDEAAEAKLAKQQRKQEFYARTKRQKSEGSSGKLGYVLGPNAMAVPQYHSLLEAALKKIHTELSTNTLGGLLAMPVVSQSIGQLLVNVGLNSFKDVLRLIRDNILAPTDEKPADSEPLMKRVFWGLRKSIEGIITFIFTHATVDVVKMMFATPLQGGIVGLQAGSPRGFVPDAFDLIVKAVDVLPVLRRGPENSIIRVASSRLYTTPLRKMVLSLSIYLGLLKIISAPDARSLSVFMDQKLIAYNQGVGLDEIKWAFMNLTRAFSIAITPNGAQGVKDLMRENSLHRIKRNSAYAAMVKNQLKQAGKTLKDWLDYAVHKKIHNRLWQYPNSFELENLYDDVLLLVRSGKFARTRGSNMRSLALMAMFKGVASKISQSTQSPLEPVFALNVMLPFWVAFDWQRAFESVEHEALQIWNVLPNYVATSETQAKRNKLWQIASHLVRIAAGKWHGINFGTLLQKAVQIPATSYLDAHELSIAAFVALYLEHLGDIYTAKPPEGLPTFPYTTEIENERTFPGLTGDVPTSIWEAYNTLFLHPLMYWDHHMMFETVADFPEPDDILMLESDDDDD